jgi:hypothetical protein
MSSPPHCELHCFGPVCTFGNIRSRNQSSCRFSTFRTVHHSPCPSFKALLAMLVLRPIGYVLRPPKRVACLTGQSPPVSSAMSRKISAQVSLPLRAYERLLIASAQDLGVPMERSHARGGGSRPSRSHSRAPNTDVEDAPAATLKRRRRSSSAATQPRRRRLRSAASSRATSPARTASPSPSPPPSTPKDQDVWVQVPSWDDVRRAEQLRRMQQALRDAGKIRPGLTGDLIGPIISIDRILGQRDIGAEDVVLVLRQTQGVASACGLRALWEAYMALIPHCM